MSAYDYQYGPTEEAMQLLPALGIKAAPLSGYRPYSVTARLGDGTLQGHGAPVITWHWSFISVAERAVFIESLGDALSGPAFIRTRLPNNTWATFECIQNRPTGEENLSNNKILNFDLTFTYCILIPDE
jgi:hypothetical protein